MANYVCETCMEYALDVADGPLEDVMAENVKRLWRLALELEMEALADNTHASHGTAVNALVKQKLGVE